MGADPVVLCFKGESCGVQYAHNIFSKKSGQLSEHDMIYYIYWILC